MRQAPEFVDALIGEAITEGTALIVAGLCNGDLGPIFSEIEDPAANEFVRGQRVDSLVVIARQQPELRPEVVGYLERFPSSDFDKPETLCSSWAFAVAALGLARLEPQDQEAFEHQWISPLEVNFEFFQKQLRIAVEEGEATWLQNSRNTRLIESAIDDLSGWYCFSDEFLEDQVQPRASGNILPGFFGDTFECEAPKVGRNDPCPCGSGKKFKKCRLQ